MPKKTFVIFVISYKLRFSYIQNIYNIYTPQKNTIMRHETYATHQKNTPLVSRLVGC